MRSRYQPDLKKYLSLCGRNYAALQQLLIKVDDEHSHHRYCWKHPKQSLWLRLGIIERTPYTELVELERICDPIPHVPLPKMQIRLYHDAQLAEVLSTQPINRLLPVYDYPNERMLQPNEKLVINEFLAELLSPLRQSEWLMITDSEEGDLR